MLSPPRWAVAVRSEAARGVCAILVTGVAATGRGPATALLLSRRRNKPDGCALSSLATPRQGATLKGAKTGIILEILLQLQSICLPVGKRLPFQLQIGSREFSFGSDVKIFIVRLLPKSKFINGGQ